MDDVALHEFALIGAKAMLGKIDEQEKKLLAQLEESRERIYEQFPELNRKGTRRVNGASLIYSADKPTGGGAGSARKAKDALRIVADAGGPIGTPAIASALGLKISGAEYRLRAIVNKGWIRRCAPGTYEATADGIAALDEEPSAHTVAAPMRPKSPATKAAALADLKKPGATLAQVARAHGIAATTVRSWRDGRRSKSKK